MSLFILFDINLTTIRRDTVVDAINTIFLSRPDPFLSHGKYVIRMSHGDFGTDV